jgi:hypothetical protein
MPADLAKEKLVVGALHKLVSSNYNPLGCQVLYAGVYGKSLLSGESWRADPYTYSLYILRYLCDRQSADKSKYYVDYATPTTVNITANAIYTLNTLYAAHLPADEFRGYLKLENRPVLKNGFYFMGQDVVGDSHLENKIKEYRWLITYNDSLPFTYLNRRDYLMIQKKRLEKTITESPSQQSWLSQYQKNIDNYLMQPDSELNKTAICRWNEEERFEHFVDEGTPGSFIAIKPDLSYYHKKLPASSPQFFSVVYKISHGDPVFEDNISRIQQAVDFTKLRNMLGK